MLITNCSGYFEREIWTEQTILDSHIDASLIINTLGKHAYIMDIRKFYDTVEAHCRGLQAIGVDPKSYSII